MFDVPSGIFSSLTFTLFHMKKVFISRDIFEDSIFRKMLTANGFEVHGESLVDFSPVPIAQLPPADWLFFYSKTGVRYFFQQISPEKITGVKLAAIGPGTAEALENEARLPDFTGDGDPESTAAFFLQTAKGRRVLCPRARESRQSIQKLLEPYLTALDLVVYENSPRQDFDLPYFDVLVFTSPMNAQAYFSKKRWRENQKVVAIGKTTAKALAELGIERVSLAENPSEESLAAEVLKS